MSIDIVPETPAAVNPRTERLKECCGCGNEVAMTGLYCPSCMPVVAPAKLAPLPYESPALCVTRLGTQARMNGSTATPCGVYGRIQWRVTSQRAHGHPHLVTLTDGAYTCSCPATRLCAHIALVRTAITDCPACAGPLCVFAPPRGCGALYCPACGVRADLDPDETEGVWAYYHDMGGPIRVMIAAILARVTPIGEVA